MFLWNFYLSIFYFENRIEAKTREATKMNRPGKDTSYREIFDMATINEEFIFRNKEFSF